MSLGDLATICASHLAAEEYLLVAALPNVRALKLAFETGGFESLQNAGERQRTLEQTIDEMKTRRVSLRVELARRMKTTPSIITLSQVVETLPEPTRQTLRHAIANVRALAEELVTANHWLAVHLRIHLDAYQRLLRELTRTASGSGRYGRSGAAETVVYRPFFEIHG